MVEQIQFDPPPSSLGFLQSQALLSSLNAAETIFLASFIDLRSYNHKDTIFSVEHNKYPIIYIQKGACILSYRTPPYCKNLLHIDVLGPGDYFFADTFLDNNLKESHLILHSLFECNTYNFSQDACDFISKKNIFNQSFRNKLLSERIARLSPYMYALSLYTIQQKVAYLLLRFYEKFAIKRNTDSGTINIQIPHKLVANFFQSSRETISKVFKSLSALELIAYMPGRPIFIPSVEKLKKFLLNY